MFTSKDEMDIGGYTIISKAKYDALLEKLASASLDIIFLKRMLEEKEKELQALRKRQCFKDEA